MNTTTQFLFHIFNHIPTCCLVPPVVIHKLRLELICLIVFFFSEYFPGGSQASSKLTATERKVPPFCLDALINRLFLARTVLVFRV
ncbi:hypothetical protein CEXT_685951 [Caerostris extrusa]|uniref:Secreted protein n=1 Tax=Caerostris extrusa TaxID=172846 RepID=A0AAV4S052_CAEEX|nr:hypothetical protein CEXT_685951 [Caerostris extrusa]